MNDSQAPIKKPLISVRDIGVSYWLKKSLFKRRVFWALKNVSFDLYAGDSLGVIGKNGVGKSTLLRLLTGAIQPDYGTIKNNGASTQLLTLTLGFTGYLTGRENAILSSMFRGLTRKEAQLCLEDIIEFSELGEFIDQPISTYSSGMTTRLGFSIAYYTRPDILLLDEVLSVGDADFRQKSMKAMKELIDSKNHTIVFVSHSAQQVRKLCNRCIWIENRIIQMEGDTSEVLEVYEAYLKDNNALPVQP